MVRRLARIEALRFQSLLHQAARALGRFGLDELVARVCAVQTLRLFRLDNLTIINTRAATWPKEKPKSPNLRDSALPL